MNINIPPPTYNQTSSLPYDQKECVICKLYLENDIESQSHHSENKTLIFLEDRKKLLTLKCGHVFHESCVKPWIDKENTCPTCRQVARTYSVFEKIKNYPCTLKVTGVIFLILLVATAFAASKWKILTP